MTRHVALLTFALSLTSAQVQAQTVYTVREAVDIHHAPTTSSPVIGQAARGRTLELTRDIGDWAQVVWTSSPQRVGFVRVRHATVPLAAFRDLGPIHPASLTGPTTPLTEPAIASKTDQVSQPHSPEPFERTSVRSPMRFELPPHAAGVGVRINPRFHEIGGSARLWAPLRFGAQLEVLRTTATSDVFPGRLTMWQFSPAALYALPDMVNSGVWVRPFVGTGLDLVRSASGTDAPGMPATDTAFGPRLFAGAEVTLPGAPQISLSTDIGYRWLESSFTGFDLSGPRASISAHWYIK